MGAYSNIYLACTSGMHEWQAIMHTKADKGPRYRFRTARLLRDTPQLMDRQLLLKSHGFYEAHPRQEEPQERRTPPKQRPLHGHVQWTRLYLTPGRKDPPPHLRGSMPSLGGREPGWQRGHRLRRMHDLRHAGPGALCPGEAPVVWRRSRLAVGSFPTRHRAHD
jgi:hypothetical protein